MATRKRTKAASSMPSLGRLRTTMRSLQRDADKLLKQTRKRAKTLIRQDGEEALERFLGQATRLRKDVEKRAQRASRDLETRADKFRSALEKEVGQRLSSVLKRLDLPTRREIQSLSRRISDLEKKVRSRPAAPPAKAAPRPEMPAVPGLVDEPSIGES